MRAYRGRAHASWEAATAAQRAAQERQQRRHHEAQAEPISKRAGSWDRTFADIRALPEARRDG